MSPQFLLLGWDQLWNVSLFFITPRPPIFKVMLDCDLYACRLWARLNFENGGSGGGAQNFVHLPWKKTPFDGDNGQTLLELNSRFRLLLCTCAITCVINRLCPLAKQHLPQSHMWSRHSLMLCFGRRIAGHGNVLAAPTLRPRQAFRITVSGLRAPGHVFCNPCGGYGDSACVFTPRRLVSAY